jgi:hypothetical protein
LPVALMVPRGAGSMKRFFTQVCPMPNGLVVLNVSSGIGFSNLPFQRVVFRPER